MSEDSIAVITDLLHIIEKYDAETIGAASLRGGISANLRAALDALGKEARQPKRLSKKTSETPVRPAKQVQDGQKQDLEKQLSQFFMNKREFPDKTSLTNIAKQIRIPLPGIERDSRDRAARRIAKAIANSKRLRDKFEALNSTTSQTSGWFDLILGHNE